MKDSADIETTVNRGLAWIGAASSLVFLFDVLSTVLLLAIWISPGQYGVATVAITLFRVLDLASDLGVISAVIQRDDHTEDKLSTVFWINIGVSLLLAALLAFGIGPLLGAIHSQDIVKWMLTAYGGKLLFQNVYTIPMGIMRKQLRFRELSIVRTIANVAEFSGKIGFAIAGFHIWCFVAGPFFRVAFYAIGIQYYQPWRPRFVLKVREATDWLVYGIKTSASQILFQIYTNLDYQVVGYYFGPDVNGLYKFAYDLVLDPCRVIAEAVHPLGFAAYSRLKGMRDKLIEQFVMFTRVSIVIMIGFLGVVLVSTDELILTFWTEKWLPAATAAKILCAVGLFRALSFVVPPLLDGIGRPGLTLTYTVIAAVVLPLTFVAGAELLGDQFAANQKHLSVAIAWVVGYPIAFFVLALMGLSVLQMTVVEYLSHVWGLLVCAALSIGAGLAVDWTLASAPPELRLLGSTATLIGVFLLLLAYWQGISVNSVIRALKRKGKPADAGTGDDDRAAAGDDDDRAAEITANLREQRPADSAVSENSPIG